jgi:hypothetical protein
MANKTQFYQTKVSLAVRFALDDPYFYYDKKEEEQEEDGCLES